MTQTVQISTSAKPLDQRKIKEIADLTAVNSHSDAYAAAAKLLGLTNYVKVFRGVEMIQAGLTHKPQEITRFEYSIYKKMMQYAKSNLNPDDYSALDKAL